MELYYICLLFESTLSLSVKGNMCEILLTKIQENDGGQIIAIVDYAKSVLEQSSELPSDSIKSILNSIYRLDKINLNNIFTYKPVAEINEKMCSHLNVLKNKSTQAFKPFVSYSTKSLCHSM